MTGERCRRLPILRVLGALVLATVGSIWPGRVLGAEMPRVRSSNAFIRQVIDDAIAASPTFEKIVTAIGATDGIVYVEQGPCYRGVRACLSLSVTHSAGFRFLRVFVDLHGASRDAGRLDLIGTIGHELWHALEVLNERSLTTTTAIFQFYEREFPTARATFETAAAMAAGAKVRKEAAGRVGRPVTVATRHTWRDQCGGPESSLGTDGWWSWPCT